MDKRVNETQKLKDKGVKTRKKHDKGKENQKQMNKTTKGGGRKRRIKIDKIED